MRKTMLCAGLCLGLAMLGGCAGQPSAENGAAPAAVGRTRVVACVGDSNTAGYGGESYAVSLSEQLGDGWDVRAFGVCGASAMTSGAYPYSDTLTYAESLESVPDVVILMLGTNDTATWHGADTFAREYEALLETYLALSSQPRLILCTPPAPQTDDWPQGTVSFGVQPACFDALNAAIQNIAERHGLTLVDIYSLTQNHPDWFIDDGIHLDPIGARAVGQALAIAVKSA